MKVSKSILVSVLCATALLADTDTKVQQIEVPVDKCSAPVLSIAINDIDCKAQSCQDTGLPHGGFAALAALASGQGNMLRV